MRLEIEIDLVNLISGILILVGVIAYWFLIPYQFYIRLSDATILGSVVANTLLFIFTVFCGICATGVGLFFLWLFWSDL